MVFKNVRKLARRLYHNVHSLARIKTTRRGSEKAAGEIFHRIEHGEEADNQDGEEDNDHVGGVDADGIGVDDEVARRAAEAEESEGLLEIANQQAEQGAGDSTEEGNHASLAEENAENQTFVRTEAAQCDDIGALVYHEHRNRTDNVEASNEEDEREKEICHRLLDVHNVESVFLLLGAVQRFEAGTERLTDAPQRLFGVGRGFEFKFQ